jgi:hypothetical protein
MRGTCDRIGRSRAGCFQRAFLCRGMLLRWAAFQPVNCGGEVAATGFVARHAMLVSDIKNRDLRRL